MRQFACIPFFLLATPAFPQDTVELKFTAEMAGAPLNCDSTYHGVGVTGAPIQVTDFRMFVSNVAFITEDGATREAALKSDRRWQTDRVALLDFEDATGACTNGTAATNSIVRVAAPEFDYTGVTFDLGIPFDLNHGDPTLAPSPLNLTAMFWNWRAGYKFVKFETRPAIHGDALTETANQTNQPEHDKATGFFVHLGSTMCGSTGKTNAPKEQCRNPNLVTITLAEFDPAHQSIVVDPSHLLVESDLAANSPDTGPGCMSSPDDPDCNAVLTKLGLNIGEAPTSSQVLVSVR